MLQFAYIVLRPTPCSDEFVIQSACFLDDIYIVDSFQRDKGYETRRRRPPPRMTVLETMTNPLSVRFRNQRAPLYFFCGAEGLRALRDMILYLLAFYFGRFNALSPHSFCPQNARG